jgi:hypothetical protein
LCNSFWPETSVHVQRAQPKAKRDFENKNRLKIDRYHEVHQTGKHHDGQIGDYPHNDEKIPTGPILEKGTRLEPQVREPGRSQSEKHKSDKLSRLVRDEKQISNGTAWRCFV